MQPDGQKLHLLQFLDNKVLAINISILSFSYYHLYHLNVI